MGVTHDPGSEPLVQMPPTWALAHAPAPQYRPKSPRRVSLIPSSPPPLLLPPSGSQPLVQVLPQSWPWGRYPHITVLHTHSPEPGIAWPYLRRWCSQFPGGVLCPGRWR